MSIEKRPRIGKNRLYWALNKLLKGAGDGADPTEIGIGTGADEVAAGNHTHTLIEDVIGSAISGTTAPTSGYFGLSNNVDPGGDWSLASVTPTFASGSRAVSVAFLNGGQDGGDSKLQLLMGGVMVAESASLPVYLSMSVIILVATRALSGAQVCSVRVHNYGGEISTVTTSGGFNADRPISAGIGAGSIKI